MDATASRPLYWPLQEFIYANGELETPIRWAAQRVRDEHPEFAGDIRPLNFTGEAMFPWMFEQERALRPFKPAMDVLMEDTHFGTIYDADQLARNEVPLQAAVYFDDMYVDSGLQLDTLSRVGRSHYWTTNEFEHDGVHGSVVFKRLFNEALTGEIWKNCSDADNPSIYRYQIGTGNNKEKPCPTQPSDSSDTATWHRPLPRTCRGRCNRRY